MGHGNSCFSNTCCHGSASELCRFGSDEQVSVQSRKRGELQVETQDEAIQSFAAQYITAPTGTIADKGLLRIEALAGGDNDTPLPDRAPNRRLSKLMMFYREQQKGFLEKYQLGKRLAFGEQGVTYMATEQATGRTVAVKKPIDIQNISDFKNLQTKTHPNIVRVFELFHNTLETYIVMEYCAGGDLFTAIEDLRKPTQNWCAAVMKQVLLGILYLHQQLQESHNDLKPENILLDRKPTDTHDIPRAMIADFGCLGLIGTITQRSGGGDPRYRAPETFKDAVFDEKTDAWSIGVALFELVTGGLMIHINTPSGCSWSKFDGTAQCEKLMAALEAGTAVDLSKVPANKKDLYTLLEGFLCVNPAARLTIQAGLENPWFRLAASTVDVALPDDVLQSLGKRTRCHALGIALLNLIGSQLQGESINFYRKMWHKYDTNCSGHIEFKEFSAMLEEIQKQPNSGNSALMTSYPTAQALFEFADVTRNGSIDFTEFVGLMFNADKLSDREKTEYFKSAFRYLAGDDHQISCDEFATLFEHGEESKDVVAQLFLDLDVNGSGHIDYQEFEAYVDQL